MSWIFKKILVNLNFLLHIDHSMRRCSIEKEMTLIHLVVCLFSSLVGPVLWLLRNFQGWKDFPESSRNGRPVNFSKVTPPFTQRYPQAFIFFFWTLWFSPFRKFCLRSLRIYSLSQNLKVCRLLPCCFHIPKIFLLFCEFTPISRPSSQLKDLFDQKYPADKFKIYKFINKASKRKSVCCLRSKWTRYTVE